mmetsp:Transcript_61044/g.163957  ORF Transcript_61044/g.163957 Transcript_61044/m.163957 type:complete len:131 (-) Transcript_61044:86-478(-)
MRILSELDDGSARCSNQWSSAEIWESFDCESIPGGDYIKVSLAESIAKCNQSGLSCPSDLICFCKPCVENPESNYFNWRLVLAVCVAIYAVGIFFALFLRNSDQADLISRPAASRGRGSGRSQVGAHHRD